MKRPLFNLNDPATMARVRQTLREEEQSEGGNIVAPTGPTANVQDHEDDHDQPNMPSAPSTRIPETLIIPATAPAPVAPPRQPNRPNNDVDNLRIRNAIQREELRSSAKQLRQAYERMGQMEEEATTHRKQLLNYREVLRETNLWMEGSMFCAMVLAICVLLYVAWCWVNRAEFEYQEKLLRRNLGLD